MGLIYNQTSISPASHVYINNQDQQKVLFNNQLVWQRSLTIYDASVNHTSGVTPINFDSVYINAYTSDPGDGVGSWCLIPWTNGDANERRGAVIRSSGLINLTGFSTMYCTYYSQIGYGDAAKNSPRCMLYCSPLSNQPPFNTVTSYGDPVNFSAVRQIDGAYGSYTTQAMSFNLSGNYYVYVDNWSAGGTSSVHVRKIWLE